MTVQFADYAVSGEFEDVLKFVTEYEKSKQTCSYVFESEHRDPGCKVGKPKTKKGYVSADEYTNWGKFESKDESEDEYEDEYENVLDALREVREHLSGNKYATLEKGLNTFEKVLKRYNILKLELGMLQERYDKKSLALDVLKATTDFSVYEFQGNYYLKTGENYHGQVLIGKTEYDALIDITIH